MGTQAPRRGTAWSSRPRWLLATLVQEVRLQNSISRPTYSPPRAPDNAGSTVDGTAWQLGQRVIHRKFGEGIILNYEGQGKQARVQVNFDAEGSKWLMVAYVNLEAAV